MDSICYILSRLTRLPEYVFKLHIILLRSIRVDRTSCVDISVLSVLWDCWQESATKTTHLPLNELGKTNVDSFIVVTREFLKVWGQRKSWL
jgi:hypothetical protein